jgi:hypothetical protein
MDWLTLDDYRDPRSQFGEDSFVEVYDFADRIDR